DPGRLAGLRRTAGVAAFDQRFERVVAILIGPGAVATPRRVVDPLQRLSVLIVVDEQVGAFAVRYLSDLGAGKRGVEQDHARAALGRRKNGVEEPAVVTDQDRAAIPRMKPVIAPAVGDRV